MRLGFVSGIVVGGLVAIGFNSYFSAQAGGTEKLPINIPETEGRYYRFFQKILDSVPKPDWVDDSREPKSYSIPVNDGGKITVWFKGSQVVKTTVQHRDKTVCEF